MTTPTQSKILVVSKCMSSVFRPSFEVAREGWILKIYMYPCKVSHKQSNIKRILPIDPPCKKKMYNTLGDAQDMIHYIKQNRSGKELFAYNCLICGFWHLTSKPK
jgi:hypothetical protein